MKRSKRFEISFCLITPDKHIYRNKERDRDTISVNQFTRSLNTNHSIQGIIKIIADIFHFILATLLYLCSQVFYYISNLLFRFVYKLQILFRNFVSNKKQKKNFEINFNRKEKHFKNVLMPYDVYD